MLRKDTTEIIQTAQLNLRRQRVRKKKKHNKYKTVTNKYN